MIKRILVAEDEQIIAMDIKRVLEKAGFEIASVAASALEVIEQADKYKPDVILMDIMLKGELSGIEAAQIINYNHNIPIIFLTALQNADTVRKANLPKYFGYIVKPFEEQVLIHTINSLPEKMMA